MADDVVWKLALCSSYLGIPPGQEHTSPRAFLLRRLETTWKNEYITRYNVLSRWASSATTYVAHRPLLIPVPNIHLLSDGESLLVAPQHFSWVLRTIPSTAKVLKGHFQPTLSNQAHPTNDWRPPAAGAIASHGGMAKIAWGSQAGDVMIKTAQKAMDLKANRRTSVIASGAVDGHDGLIHHVSWASSATGCEFFVTSGEDCRMKIWDAETCTPVWTSDYTWGQPFIQVICDVPTRTAVALTRKGLVAAWSGLPLSGSATGSKSIVSLSAIVPSDDVPDLATTLNCKLLFDPSPTEPIAIVHSQENLSAWAMAFDFTAGSVRMTRLEGPLGPIISSCLDISNRKGEQSILMLGDALSQLSIYDLSRNDASIGTKLTATSVTANVRINTSNSMSSITAIATNRIVVVTGDDVGNISVWNALTLERIRVVMSAELSKDGVGVISLVCQGEQLVASVGRSVLHWKTGATPSRYKKPGRTIKASVPRSKVKDVDVRYRQAIKDFQVELEMTAKKKQPTVYPEREHMAALDSLGLDEASAIEYALMISREEAQGGTTATISDNELEAALFSSSPPNSTGSSSSEDDLMSQTSNPHSSPRFGDPETGPLAGYLMRRDAEKEQDHPELTYTVPMSSPSFSKSHFHIPERKESSLNGESGSAKSESVGSGHDEDFPQISAIKSQKTPLGPAKSSLGSASIPAATSTAKPAPKPLSNWSAVARVHATRDLSTPPSTSSSSQKRGSGTPTTALPRRPATISYDNIAPLSAADEDAQLRLALELSMAEAISRNDAPKSS
ncbi:hypothetical protein FRC17_004947 [Serendipita sp. 399]|nr:hypothetical protein FRC17_004947 [Serendipita sp. 399]